MKKYSLVNNPIQTIIQIDHLIWIFINKNYEIIRKILLGISFYIYFDYWNPYLHSINIVAFNYLFWIFLGILSSIGFGTGLQTGMLFVFPKIINTYNTNYSDDLTIWYNIYYCYLYCIPFVLFWGLGTALGELPPYLIARTIKYDVKNKNNNNKIIKLIGKENTNNLNYYIEKFKENSKYNFYILLLFSAWPNAIFDMCGVVTGIVGLKLHEFLIPTIIGKTFIKTPLQLLFILYSYAFFGETFKNNEEIGYIYYLWITFIISFTLYTFKEYIESLVN